MQLKTFFLTGGVALASITAAEAETFAQHVDVLAAKARAAGVSEGVVRKATRNLTADPAIDRLTKRQPELVKPIGDYIMRRVNGPLAKTGRAKLRANPKTAKAIERTFGVPAEIVFAIWGMESGYGANIGRSNVPRSLATLSWKGYRGDFFTGEFVDALRIAEAETLDPSRMVGSWAGAVGHTQFIPSTFRKFAVDLNGDGKRDLWTTPGDALGSTANFLFAKGWVQGQPWGYAVRQAKGAAEPVATRSWAAWAKRGVTPVSGARYPKTGQATMFYPAGQEGPSFLITTNYDIIREYNSSDAYSLSVALTGDRIAGAGPLKASWPGDATLNKAERMVVQKRLAAKGYDVPNRTGRIIRGVREAIAAFQRDVGVFADGYPDQTLLKQLRN